MTDEYINKINLKKEKEKLKGEIWFGQGTGLVILIIASLKFLDTTKSYTEVKMIIAMVIGLILFSFGLFFPYVLYYPCKWMKEIFNKFFTLILMCILSILYIILVLPVGLIKRKKWAQQYGFYFWNNNKNDLKFKGFSKLENRGPKDLKGIQRRNRINTIFTTIGYFMERKNFILIPILFLLIFIGLLFFFVTSSVITPMIYTLF